MYYLMVTVDVHAVHQLQEFHGKKSVTTTEEKLDLDDEDDEKQQMIYFQHIPTKNAGPIAN